MYHKFVQVHSYSAKKTEEDQERFVQDLKRLDHQQKAKALQESDNGAKGSDDMQHGAYGHFAEEKIIDPHPDDQSDKHIQPHFAEIACIKHPEDEHACQYPIDEVKCGDQPTRKAELFTDHSVGFVHNTEEQAAAEHHAHRIHLNLQAHLNSLPKNPLDFSCTPASR